MKLSSGPVQLKLSIEGYQWPENQSCRYDSNWLIIRLDVEHPEGGWTAFDPALLTFEAKALVNWLVHAAEPGCVRLEIGFLEPCLKLRFLPTESALRVYLRGELRPDRLRFEDAPQEFYLDFPIGSEGLEECAGSFARMLERFPERAAAGS